MGSSQIPDPAKIFIIFPIPALYFDQIPDPENTLPEWLGPSVMVQGLVHSFTSFIQSL